MSLLSADQREGGWIQTFSGGQFWPLDPRAEELDINDIAHALSNTCRYGGHCTGYYSVAQHSVLVSQACRPENALTGLLHDGSEAYLGDVPRPIKHGPGMEAFRDFEHALERVIAKEFGLAYPFPHDVEWADSALLATEKRDLLAHSRAAWTDTEWLHGSMGVKPLAYRIKPWSPADSEDAFLRRFRELTA